MEKTALSIGKSVLSGAVSYAKSALAEEVALQLGVETDQIFIANELEMMQGFLMAAHDERDDNTVVKVWVKQVRDLAYDVEDTLHEFAICLSNRSWWRIFHTLHVRSRVAKEMKQLRASVEDVSQRYMRYNLIKGSSSKTTMAAEHSRVTSATVFGIKAAGRSTNQGKSKMDVVQDDRDLKGSSSADGEIVEHEAARRTTYLCNSKWDLLHDDRVFIMGSSSGNPYHVGRVKEKNEIIKLVSNQDSHEFQVISIWGMGGVGKTTIVKDILVDQVLTAKFEKQAFVTVMRPLVLLDLIRQLVTQLDSSETLNSLEDWTSRLVRILKGSCCLIVIDDISSSTEWDMLVPVLVGMSTRGRVLVTTREGNIALHCSRRRENVHRLKELEDKEAYDLFCNKVFKEGKDLEMKYPELVEQADLILTKCGRLPLAIVTIGGFLANRPKTALEWKRLNDHLAAEMEGNPEFESIRTALIASYDGLPYHLKSCFLYMPLFPADFWVGRGRLVRRWTAEGYPNEVRGKSLEEVAQHYFMDLVSRSVIIPGQNSVHSRKGIDMYELHDMMHEIALSKSIEENLCFTLEDGCSLKRETMRHLAINGNWKGDRAEFESMVDMSRVRSVTIFGKFEPFFVSKKMTFLRVLDMENTYGLRNHHLKEIGRLLHLRYFSVKGCSKIDYLPNSFGNLRELLTLDLRGTRIRMLPKSIINLRKLENLFAGAHAMTSVPIATQYGRTWCDLCHPGEMCLICAGWCVGQLWCDSCRKKHEDEVGLIEECTMCCSNIRDYKKRLNKYSVTMPRGIRKMRYLRKLGAVNIGLDRKYLLHEIRELSRLQKLGVTGVNKENGKELCLTVEALSCLESLSVEAEDKIDGLFECLEGTFSFPENLQSLKLYGNIMKLPEWVKGLTNLVKLKMRSIVFDHDAMQVLADLPNLAFLCLLGHSFDEVGEDVHLMFSPVTFRSLKVLELDFGDRLKSLQFCVYSAPKLKLLKFSFTAINSESISGLQHLKGLEEIVLQGNYKDHELEFLRAEVAGHRNRPILKARRIVLTFQFEGTRIELS